jgi:hypothetical protein
MDIINIERAGNDNDKEVLISDYRKIWLVNLEKCKIDSILF